MTTYIYNCKTTKMGHESKVVLQDNFRKQIGIGNELYFLFNNLSSCGYPQLWPSVSEFKCSSVEAFIWSHNAQALHLKTRVAYIQGTCTRLSWYFLLGQKTTVINIRPCPLSMQQVLVQVINLAVWTKNPGTKRGGGGGAGDGFGRKKWWKTGLV